MKIKIALFFSILFISVLTVPTVVSLIDDTQNISLFLDLSEEEEKKGKESSLKDVEVKVHPQQNSFCLFNEMEKKRNIQFCTKSYASCFPKIDTPPPEFA